MRTLHRGNTPLYKQIIEYIRERIDQGEWEVGEKIPTESALVDQFNVSRITFVKALERLVDEGYLRREQGKGTFVKNPSLSEEPSELLSFSESVKKEGKKPSSIILEKNKVVPSARISQVLQLNCHDHVWNFKRLMLANNEPIGVQTSYFSVDTLPKFDQHVYDNVSLYEILRNEYAVHIDNAVETYSAVQLDEEEKRLLDVKRSVVGFSVERLSFMGKQPVEFVRSIMRSDKTNFTVKLVRK